MIILSGSVLCRREFHSNMKNIWQALNTINTLGSCDNFTSLISKLQRQQHLAHLLHSLLSHLHVSSSLFCYFMIFPLSPILLNLIYFALFICFCLSGFFLFRSQLFNTWMVPDNFGDLSDLTVYKSIKSKFTFVQLFGSCQGIWKTK